MCSRTLFRDQHHVQLQNFYQRPETETCLLPVESQVGFRQLINHVMCVSPKTKCNCKHMNIYLMAKSLRMEQKKKMGGQK